VTKTPDLSVVILTWNTVDLTMACLAALEAERAPRYTREVIVVDNGSVDGTAAAVRERFPDVRLVRNEDNRYYAAGNNQGAQAARGKWVCLLNSDTEVREGALDSLVDFLEQHPDYGACAPKLVNPDGSVQRACQNFPTLMSALCFDSFWGSFWPGRWVEDRYLMRAFDHLESRDVAQPPGAVFCMNREEYVSMGGLDEQLYLFYNDVDICKRLWKKGRKVRYLAEAEVMHHQGASTSGHSRFLVTWHQNRLTYYRKHYGPLVMVWMRFVTWARAIEESIKIGRRNPDKDRRRAEREYLWAAYREVWSEPVGTTPVAPQGVAT